MIIDLHVHTRPRSADSELDIPALVQRAKDSGLEAVCLTEHDSFWDEKVLTEASERHGFLLLPGAEITTEDGHFLVFGLDHYVLGMHHSEGLARLAIEAGAAVLMAHPFRSKLDSQNSIDSVIEEMGRKPFFKLIDGIETLNGRDTPREIQCATLLSQRLNLKGAGSSDAHATSEMPTGATRFDREIKSAQELAEELRAGRFQALDLRR